MVLTKLQELAVTAKQADVRFAELALSASNASMKDRLGIQLKTHGESLSVRLAATAATVNQLSAELQADPANHAL